MYYAFVHTYGANMRDGGNRRMGVVVKFATDEARDAFVNAGPAYRNDPRYREEIDASEITTSYREDIIASDDWADFCARTGWAQ